MSAKNSEKIQPLGHFFGLALGKKLQFFMVRSKNQNKSRISLNTTKLYRHIYKNTYRRCAKMRILVKKKKKIETYSESYKTLHILYMYFYRSVPKIPNNFRFILIFRLKRVKSQLQLHLGAAKSEAVGASGS